MASKMKLAGLYAMHETVFATEPDADGSDYKFIKATEISPFSPSADVIERPGMVRDLVRQPHVLGPKGGSFSFKTELKASGTAAADAVAAIASESSPFLESVLGSVTRGTGTTVGVGSSTTAIVCVATAGLAVGMAVEINNEIRIVTAIADGTHFTVDRALAGAPSNADVVYASSMFKRSNTGHKSLAFVVFRDGIEYTALGCYAKVKLEGINAKGTAHLSVEVTVGSWAVTTKASLPSTTLAGITAVLAPVIKGAPYALAGTEAIITGLDLDLGAEFMYQESTAAADNKAGLELVDMKPSGTVKPWYAAGNLTAFYAGTEQSMVFSAGSRTTGFAIYIGKAQYAPPALEDRGGIVGESIGFMVNDNGASPELTVCVF